MRAKFTFKPERIAGVAIWTVSLSGEPMARLRRTDRVDPWGVQLWVMRARRADLDHAFRYSADTTSDAFAIARALLQGLPSYSLPTEPPTHEGNDAD